MLQSEFGRKSQARTSVAAKSTRNIAVQRNALDQKLIFYYLAIPDPERISELGIATPLYIRCVTRRRFAFNLWVFERHLGLPRASCASPKPRGLPSMSEQSPSVKTFDSAKKGG